MSNLVSKEFARIIDAEKHYKNLYGKYLSFLIESRQLPLAVCIRLMENFAKEGRTCLVDHMVGSLESRGEEHPLIDEFYAKYLWSIGKRDQAVDLAKFSAAKWNREYLNELARILEEKSKP
jgi:hypothetical protein